MDALIIQAGLNRDQDGAEFVRALLKRKRRELEKAQADVHLGFCALARLDRQWRQMMEDFDLSDPDSGSDGETLPRAFRGAALGRDTAPEPSAPCRGAVGEHKKRKQTPVCINIGQVNIADRAFENNRGTVSGRFNFDDTEDRRRGTTAVCRHVRGHGHVDTEYRSSSD